MGKPINFPPVPLKGGMCISQIGQPDLDDLTIPTAARSRVYITEGEQLGQRAGSLVLWRGLEAGLPAAVPSRPVSSGETAAIHCRLRDTRHGGEVTVKCQGAPLPVGVVTPQRTDPLRYLSAAFGFEWHYHTRWNLIHSK